MTDVADKPKANNEKPIKLPGDPGERGDSDEFKDLLADLMATGPTPAGAGDPGDDSSR